MNAAERPDQKPPYKLLACDGGGIRGIISIQILARIESELRQASGRSDLVLADYFDYVAGTSTGAIIATLVALGYDTGTIRGFYLESGREMFAPAALWDRLHAKFNEDNLSRLLQRKIGSEETLGTDKLKTLLMIVLRNATTDSPWPLSNNPRAKYNDRATCGEGSNLNLPLWQLIRASTAAPTYFPPETIQVGTQRFVFVDGAVTMYNDPAFQLFLMATTEPYRLCWESGRDKMLLVSIGTGASADAHAKLTAREMNVLYNASHIPSALMAAALHEQDFLCRTFGDCLVGEALDSEIGDMRGQGIPGVPKLFTYLRYNLDLSQKGLDALGLTDVSALDVQRLDSVEHLPELRRVGVAAANQVASSHFARFPA